MNVEIETNNRKLIVDNEACFVWLEIPKSKAIKLFGDMVIDGISDNTNVELDSIEKVCQWNEMFGIPIGFIGNILTATYNDNSK